MKLRFENICLTMKTFFFSIHVDIIIIIYAMLSLEIRQSSLSVAVEEASALFSIPHPVLPLAFPARQSE